MARVLGCLADDFTGATDLAGVLVENGMTATVVLNFDRAPLPDTDAVIVALKIRTAPVEEAISQARGALHWLQRIGCRRFYLKYCSTFDSRPSGNIGPVMDLMMDQLATDSTIVCPAYPINRRTVYQGNLFVDGQPLAESGMRLHPLTPMTDSNLLRVLQPQTRRTVGLIPHEVVTLGAEAIRQAFAPPRTAGKQVAVVDAICDQDLREITLASDDLLLLTGASGLGVGLPEQLRRSGLLAPDPSAVSIPRIEGYRAIISGSCSAATQRQVALASRHMPVLQIDPVQALDIEAAASRIADWARERLPDGPVLISSTANAASVTSAQQKLGTDQAGTLVEKLIAACAVHLVDAGVRKLIVAGGETSGAVVSALNLHSLDIGPRIDPGVNWTLGVGKVTLALALKSGNFGTDDFFIKAWSLLND